MLINRGLLRRNVFFFRIDHKIFETLLFYRILLKILHKLYSLIPFNLLFIYLIQTCIQCTLLNNKREIFTYLY
jgi:hypothetical protein